MKASWTLILCLCFGFAKQTVCQTLAEHNPEYRLEYSDSVVLTFRYTPEFNQEVTVGPDGRVTVAGLGTMVARGLTMTQFNQQLLTLASSHLVNPEISLSLKNYVKPHVYVEGEVNTPGRVELREGISVLDAVALAGGFKESGAQKNVLLAHMEGAGDTQTRVVDLTYFIHQHKLDEIPRLRSGDVIYVSKTKFSTLQKIVRLGDFGVIYNPVPH